ncbi:MAG: hypothetical protein IPI62_16120 [Bacteroidetes bacterium]|nr:hypothetical protein [Bacteroidota bacterium]
MSANSAIVVSRPIENIFTMITLFSWMFAFSESWRFLFMCFQLSLTYSQIRMEFDKKRSQVSVVLVVVLSFILVGAVLLFTSIKISG